MAQSLGDILLHIVFSTKDRREIIDDKIELNLFQYIAKTIENLGSQLIVINGAKDHVHILIQMNKVQSPSNLISEIKSSSSKWIKSKGDMYRNFAWQAGYGVFSVSRLHINNVIEYIENQKEHHKKISFKDELIKILNQRGIQYDESYLWS